MTELEYKALAAQGYNRIPLIAESFADLETPLSLYLKLARGQGSGANSFLLESVVGGERFGRYSFIGLPARTSIRAFIGEPGQHRIEVVTDGVVVREERGDPLLQGFLRFNRDGLFPLQAKVNPLLKVLGPHDDLFAHVDCFNIQENGKRCVVLSPQIPMPKTGVPRVLPIEIRRHFIR